MWDQTKLISVTVILSGLIWWFADQADRTEATIAVGVRLVSDEQSGLVARFPDRDRLRLMVSIRGTRKTIQALSASGSSEAVEIKWHLPTDAQLGIGSYKTQPAVVTARQFNGVTVLSVHPQEVDISVDRFDIHEVPIRVDAGSHLFTGEPTLDPPSATVRILQSNWQRIPMDSRHLVLDLEDDLSGKVEERLLSFDIALPLQLAGHPISVQPESVKIKLTLREQASERQIAPVVVKFAVASELWGDYLPQLKDPTVLRLEITVVGSEEALERISPQDVLGIIDVTSDDISQTGEFRLKRPVFLLPPGIRLKTEPPLIEFRLQATSK